MHSPGRYSSNLQKNCIEALKETDRKYNRVPITTTHSCSSTAGSALPSTSVDSSPTSNTPTASPRKRQANSMSSDIDGPFRSEKRLRVTLGYATPPSPAESSSDDMMLSDVPDFSIRDKISQIRAELTGQRIVDCCSALLQAKGSLVSAVTQIVRKEAGAKRES